MRACRSGPLPSVIIVARPVATSKRNNCVDSDPLPTSFVNTKDSPRCGSVRRAAAHAVPEERELRAVHSRAVHRVNLRDVAESGGNQDLRPVGCQASICACRPLPYGASASATATGIGWNSLDGHPRRDRHDGLLREDGRRNKRQDDRRYTRDFLHKNTEGKKLREPRHYSANPRGAVHVQGSGQGSGLRAQGSGLRAQGSGEEVSECGS